MPAPDRRPEIHKLSLKEQYDLRQQEDLQRRALIKNTQCLKREDARPLLLISCKDKRLVELASKVFSADLKFPSLRFALVMSWVGFIGLCLFGMWCEHAGYSGVAYTIKVLLLLWFGLMAAVLSPIYFIGSSASASLVALPFLLGGLFFLMRPVARFFNHPTDLRVHQLGIHAKYGILQFSLDRVVRWQNIQTVDLIQRQATNPDNWFISFRGQGKELLRVRNGTLLNSEERGQLLQYVQEYAPHAVVDPELLHLLTPVATSSYTELWLQSLAAPPKRARLAPLEPGMQLAESKYRIEEILAAGGQGVVYTATEKLPDGQERSVVVKEIILPIFGDDNTRKKELDRFVQESQLLQRLEHPQVVKLFDFFVEDHRGYLVLERITGRSLSDLVAREGPRPQADVVKLARQMCNILEYLHGLTPPLVHRDFTPDNLILADDETLKLIDFNVACAQNYTTTATVVGKRAYLPPEQFRGKPCTQSDIYAFGGTLYYLLTGEEPEPIATSHPILKRSDVSEELDRLVARATEPDLKRRYSDAAQIKGDLDAISVG